MLPALNLRLDRTVILVGAGASVASGIATGQMFNRSLLPRLIPDDLKSDERMRPLFEPAASRRRPRKGSLRFEQLIEILRQSADPELLIMQYLESSWSPSTLHQWIARAIHQGAIVLTTNLDSLIEVAYRDLFGEPLKQVIEKGEHRQYQWGDPCLFKLHGTIRREAYLQGISSGQPISPFEQLRRRALDSFGVTLDAVGSLPSSASGVQSTFLLPDHVLDTLRKILPGRDLLVLGYSGSDDFDITPSFRLLDSLLTRVIWVDHRTDALPHRRTLGKFHHVQGDTLMSIHSLFGGQIEKSAAPAFAPQARFAAFCDEWSQRINLSQEQKHLMCGAILHSMGYVSNALSIWEEGLEGVRLGDLSSLTRFCNSLGHTYLAEHSYAQAQEVYEDLFFRLQGSGDMEKKHAADPQSIDAILGYAFTQTVAGSILSTADMTENGLNLLMDFYRVFPSGSRLSEFEVKASIFLSRIIRNRGFRRFPPILGRMISKFHQGLGLEIPLGSSWLAFCFSQGKADLGELLRSYMDWPALEKNKVLRAEYLKELALWYQLQYEQDQFKIHQQEFYSLCTRLHLVFLRATYLLELADLLGQSDERSARNVYLEAASVFLKAGYEVGYAESCLGAAVMGILAGDYDEARELLTSSIMIFQNHHCDWNVEQCHLLIQDLILFRGEAAAAHAQFGSRHSDLANLVRVDQQGYNKRARLKVIKSRFYRTIKKHWRENLGISGWLTAEDVHSDSVYKDLLLPWQQRR